MHRSGTSMLTRFIKDLGIFMGRDSSENDESRFFQKLNRWLLFQAGASWDVPYAVDWIDQEFAKDASEVVLRRMDSVWSSRYLGVPAYLKSGGITGIKYKWGWKDPRNTLLLPIYKEIYPEAKILHIYRHPLDVAKSLHTRETGKKPELFKNNRSKWKEKTLYYERIIRHSLAVEDIERGIDLWEFYTEKALNANSLFSNCLHLKYEDFLSNPLEVLNELGNFLEFDADPDLITQVAKKVNINRKYAFMKDEELTQIYDRIRDRRIMHTLNYHKL